jgi:hypothetical protein
MNLLVAVHAAVPEQELGRRGCCEPCGILRYAWVPRLRMAALAQERRALGQHPRVIGAVRRMTQTTVLRDWLMLPDIRSTLFGVALIAGVVW